MTPEPDLVQEHQHNIVGSVLSLEIGFLLSVDVVYEKPLTTEEHVEHSLPDSFDGLIWKAKHLLMVNW